MEAADPTVRYAMLNERLRAAVRQEIDGGRPAGEPAGAFYVSGAAAWRYANVPDATGLDERLAELARRLGLDRLETAVLGLAAAPQLDPRYGKIFAFLHDSVTRSLPTPRTIAQLLESPGLDFAEISACFAPEGTLRVGGCLDLVDTEVERPPVDRSIVVAPEIGAFLLGAPLGDAVADARLRRIELAGLPIGRATETERLNRYVDQPGTLPLLIVGPDAPLVLAASLGRPLVVTSVRHLDDAALQRRARLVSALEDRVHVHDGVEALEPAETALLATYVETLERRILLCAERPTATVPLAIVAQVPPPTVAERAAAWQLLTGSDQCGLVATNFLLSVSQIAKGAEIANAEAGVNGRAAPDANDLAHGARIASTTKLGELATRLTPVQTWDDLVLPPRQTTLLRSISAYLRQRERVLEEWGYAHTLASTQGVKAMFAGESGTGKTMAAQIIGHELGLDIFRVDLATVVSKYIGETEKNLDRIFTAAQGSNAILFFDEADALFGKRSEVSDSHDRHANIEVAYLLQRMEGYAGAVILATNYKQNVDDAFLRRLDFVIVFPFPEVESRRRIWDRVLPEQAPRADDIDLDFLAKQFKLSGGGIRNCSLAAAFQAADTGTPITMDHLIRAVAVEYGKQGRLTLEADFARFHELIRREGLETLEHAPG